MKLDDVTKARFFTGLGGEGDDVPEPAALDPELSLDVPEPRVSFSPAGGERAEESGEPGELVAPADGAGAAGSAGSASSPLSME